MGLLDQVLGGVLKQGGQGQTGGGGLGDLLSGLAGGGQRQGGAGANLLVTLLPVVLAMLQNRGSAGAGAGSGGLGGLLQQLQTAGFGEQVGSWVGSGENVPISAEQLTSALGPARMAEIAAQAGIPEDQVSGGLASLLPELVNQLTPQGQLPAANEVDDALGSLSRSLGI